MTRHEAAIQQSNRVSVTGAYLWPSKQSGGQVPTRRTIATDRSSGSWPSAAQDWARRLDPMSIQAVISVGEARASAGLEPRRDGVGLAREGVCVGSASCAQQTRTRYASRLTTHGAAATNPIDFPDSIDGAPAAHIALYWGLQGPSLTFVDGTRSAVDALVTAARQLVLNTADRMHVVMGDLFEPRCLQAMWSAHGAMVEADCRTGDRHALERCNGLLVLILERCMHDRGPPFGYLVDFISVSGDPVLGDDAAWSDAEPKGRVFDPSGALSIAGAWLGCQDQVGSITAACQDSAMRTIAMRRRAIPNPLLPRLAFLRPSR